MNNLQNLYRHLQKGGQASIIIAINEFIFNFYDTFLRKKLGNTSIAFYNFFTKIYSKNSMKIHTAIIIKILTLFYNCYT